MNGQREWNLPRTQVFTSGTSDTIFLKFWEKNQNVYDGTDPNAGMDKDYQDGFTATLNLSKIEVQARNQDFMWGDAPEVTVDQTTEMYFYCRSVYTGK